MSDAPEDRLRFAEVLVEQAERVKVDYEVAATVIRRLADELKAERAENARLREANGELVMTAEWARNRLEKIADGSWWHGDARDFKRSLVGIFADFDEAVKKAALETKKGPGDKPGPVR